ncbi:hypothetical protein KCP69_26650 (plasmid) [Salmonella enterica subsp. enterica]|nr:hypothetical protein KCP69_26650 [Salmonella enterica subsp. enterica]
MPSARLLSLRYSTFASRRSEHCQTGAAPRRPVYAAGVSVLLRLCLFCRLPAAFRRPSVTFWLAVSRSRTHASSTDNVCSRSRLPSSSSGVFRRSVVTASRFLLGHPHACTASAITFSLRLLFYFRCTGDVVNLPLCRLNNPTHHSVRCQFSELFRQCR